MQFNKNYSFGQLKKGQAMVEYAALLSVIALALFAFSMRGYLSGTLMSKMRRDMESSFGEEQFRTNTNIQYKPSISEQVNVTGNPAPLFGLL